MYIVPVVLVTDDTDSGRDVMPSDVLAASADEKVLMKVSADDVHLTQFSPSDTKPRPFDSDGSEDSSSTNTLQDGKEDVMLLDTGDEASSHQVPCLIPVMRSGGSLSEHDGQQASSTCGTSIDGHVDVHCASPVTIAADIPNGGIQKPVGSQPFDFVNDVMRSCSPSLSKKSDGLQRPSSVSAVRGDKLTEFDRVKSRDAHHTTGQTDS